MAEKGGVYVLDETGRPGSTQLIDSALVAGLRDGQWLTVLSRSNRAIGDAG
jgi:hypothetical protein